MNFRIFINGDEIQTLVEADLREGRGLAIVTGKWAGIFPFMKLTEQPFTFELKNPDNYIRHAWISHVKGGPVNTFIEIKGILQK